MDIIPWKCHVCDEEFDTTDGGLCDVCNKPTCLNCFGIHKEIYKRPDKLICLICAFKDSEEQPEKELLEKILKKYKITREKIKGIEGKALAKLNKQPPDDVE